MADALPGAPLSFAVCWPVAELPCRAEFPSCGGRTAVAGGAGVTGAAPGSRCAPARALGADCAGVADVVAGFDPDLSAVSEGCTGVAGDGRLAGTRPGGTFGLGFAGLTRAGAASATGVAGSTGESLGRGDLPRDLLAVGFAGFAAAGAGFTPSLAGACVDAGCGRARAGAVAVAGFAGDAVSAGSAAGAAALAGGAVPGLLSFPAAWLGAAVSARVRDLAGASGNVLRGAVTGAVSVVAAGFGLRFFAPEPEDRLVPLGGRGILAFSPSFRHIRPIACACYHLGAGVYVLATWSILSVKNVKVAKLDFKIAPGHPGDGRRSPRLYACVMFLGVIGIAAPSRRPAPGNTGAPGEFPRISGGA